MDPITVAAFASFAILVVAWIAAPLRGDVVIGEELDRAA